MNVNKEMVIKIASLSKLKFDNEELKVIKEDFEKVLTFVEKVGELDTSNVEPLYFVNENFVELREDNPEITISKKEALKNAPKTDGDYFRVPKFINTNDYEESNA